MGWGWDAASLLAPCKGGRRVRRGCAAREARLLVGFAGKGGRGPPGGRSCGDRQVQSRGRRVGPPCGVEATTHWPAALSLFGPERHRHIHAHTHARTQRHTHTHPHTYIHTPTHLHIYTQTHRHQHSPLTRAPRPHSHGSRPRPLALFPLRLPPSGPRNALPRRCPDNPTAAAPAHPPHQPAAGGARAAAGIAGRPLGWPAQRRAQEEDVAHEEASSADGREGPEGCHGVEQMQCVRQSQAGACALSLLRAESVSSLCTAPLAC